MEFGFIIILFVFVNMYVYVCIVYCMYCFDLKWNSHVDSINDNVSLILKKASKRGRDKTLKLNRGNGN